jgi:ribosome-associated heat shock protein Hsp15
MRIDKYLWCTRYYKTRNKATIACGKGQVKINTQVCKPSREIYVGDTIMVRKNQIDYSLRVIAVPPSRIRAKIVNLFREDTTPALSSAHRELLKFSKEYYRKKGTGRPTKKDRRAIDGYKDDSEE